MFSFSEWLILASLFIKLRDTCSEDNLRRGLSQPTLDPSSEVGCPLDASSWMWDHNPKPAAQGYPANSFIVNVNILPLPSAYFQPLFPPLGDKFGELEGESQWSVITWGHSTWLDCLQLCQEDPICRYWVYYFNKTAEDPQQDGGCSKRMGRNRLAAPPSNIDTIAGSTVMLPVAWDSPDMLFYFPPPQLNPFGNEALDAAPTRPGNESVATSGTKVQDDEEDRENVGGQSDESSDVGGGHRRVSIEGEALKRKVQGEGLTDGTDIDGGWEREDIRDWSFLRNEQNCIDFGMSYVRALRSLDGVIDLRYDDEKRAITTFEQCQEECIKLGDGCVAFEFQFRMESPYLGSLPTEEVRLCYLLPRYEGKVPSLHFTISGPRKNCKQLRDTYLNLGHESIPPLLLDNEHCLFDKVHLRGSPLVLEKDSYLSNVVARTPTISLCADMCRQIEQCGAYSYTRWGSCHLMGTAYHAHTNEYSISGVKRCEEALAEEVAYWGENHHTVQGGNRTSLFSLLKMNAPGSLIHPTAPDTSERRNRRLNTGDGPGEEDIVGLRSDGVDNDDGGGTRAGPSLPPMSNYRQLAAMRGQKREKGSESRRLTPSQHAIEVGEELPSLLTMIETHKGVQDIGNQRGPSRDCRRGSTSDPAEEPQLGLGDVALAVHQLQAMEWCNLVQPNNFWSGPLVPGSEYSRDISFPLDCRDMCRVVYGCLFWTHHSTQQICYLHRGTLYKTGDFGPVGPRSLEKTNEGVKYICVDSDCDERRIVSSSPPGQRSELNPRYGLQELTMGPNFCYEDPHKVSIVSYDIHRLQPTPSDECRDVVMFQNLDEAQRLFNTESLAGSGWTHSTFWTDCQDRCRRNSACKTFLFLYGSFSYGTRRGDCYLKGDVKTGDSELDLGEDGGVSWVTGPAYCDRRSLSEADLVEAASGDRAAEGRVVDEERESDWEWR
eukprot:GHVN01090145.1.p1 GENE.GHVN01090145.1~~GHVN01090145.1.p1  ORF type:complete len:943 (+),score=122.76 GHVN01090145.1:1702-4530(+)